MRASRPASYRLFEVVGLELEYVVVDGELRPRCLLEEAFRRVAGRPTSYIERDEVGFSNELAAHVFEIKNVWPCRSLARAERDLVEGLRFFAAVLRDQLEARLLPTGMHPFMTPFDTELWQRSGRGIYETYARIFPIRQHGWLNIQASHINLPFGSEADTIAMHNAAAALLPYLPALAASSPAFEGALGPAMDNRLEFYKRNQQSVPTITGKVIPEYVSSYADYKRVIFKPIYRALSELPGGGTLRHEWVNSRGAIMRFGRRALEMKILDVQECIKADVAIAVFVRAALQALVERLKEGKLQLPEHEMLVEDLDAVIREGGAATVRAEHLQPSSTGRRRPTTARSVLNQLLDSTRSLVRGEERSYLAIVEDRIRNGSLAERITRQVQRRSRRPGVSEAEAIRTVYEELAECLESNRPWEG